MAHQLGPLQADVEACVSYFFNTVHLISSDLPADLVEGQAVRTYMLEVARKQLEHVNKVMERVYQATLEGKEITLPE